VITCPSGWTQLHSQASIGGAVAGAVCYRTATIADETTATYTWNTNVAQESQSGVLLFRGQDALAPIEVSAVRTQTTTSPTSPALSPAASVNSQVVRMMCADQGRVTEGAGFPSGMAHNLWLLESGDGGSGPVSGGAAIDVPGASGPVIWSNALSESLQTVNFTVGIKAGAN
jgi:hypothetical protein